MMLERQFTHDGHTTTYLEDGPDDGDLLIFVHGWPGLGLTWRHQLQHFAALGYHVVAPDLRGYGSSTVYTQPEAYSQEHVVTDMINLINHLGASQAVWIGHDWGVPTVWNIAARFPGRCRSVAALAVPFGTLDHGWTGLLPTIDRDRYPTHDYPYGQFDYMRFYEIDPHRATAVFDAAPTRTIKALYRRPDPHDSGPSARSSILREGGWFGGAPQAPDVPLADTVLTAEDLSTMTDAFVRTGFHGATCYYLNHEANERYARSAGTQILSMPALFIGATLDRIADLRSPTALSAMHDNCTALEVATVPAGHWLQMEQPQLVNKYLQDWIEHNCTGRVTSQ
jgi:soluble epoxide hydrolase/lipid-phosphate phosphatase